MHWIDYSFLEFIICSHMLEKAMKYQPATQRNSSPKRENKMLTIYSPWTIQDVDKFFSIGTDLDKFSIASLAHHWILCSEWVPSDLRVQTAGKTSQST